MEDPLPGIRPPEPPQALWRHVISTDEFDLDKSLHNQARFHALDEDRVEAYAEAMKRGDEFPPIIASGRMGKLIVSDGNHRLHAARKARKAISVYVITGDPQTIVLITFECNSSPASLPQNAAYGTADGCPTGSPPSRCTTRACELAMMVVAEHTANTAVAYASDLRSWLTDRERLGGCPLHVGRHDVQLWVRQLDASGLSAATICRRLSALAGLLRVARELGLVTDDPLRHVRRPRRYPILNRAGLTVAEVRALLVAACLHSPRAYALVALQAVNGLRVSEALAVQVTDVSMSLGHRVLYLVGKGRKAAVAPLSDLVYDAVLAAAAGRRTGPLLVTCTGRAMDRRAAARLLDRLGQEVGIAAERVHCQALRAGFVTHALQAGVPLHVVQDGARHADPRQTRAYDRGARALSDHATYAVAACLAQVVAGGEPVDAAGQPVRLGELVVPGAGQRDDERELGGEQLGIVVADQVPGLRQDQG